MRSKSRADLANAVYVKQTAAQYHVNKRALGRSGLWTFHERRQQYAAEYLEGTAAAKVVTRQMDIGSLAHMGLLEPERFPKQYAVFPESVLDKKGNETTNAAEEFRLFHERKGLIVLKKKDFLTVSAMVETARDKLASYGWLNVKAKKEQPIYWTDPETGIPCKTMIDWLVESSATAFILDFKTTGDASPPAFKYRIEDGGLWLQDAHYSDGVELKTGKPVEFYFIVCETKGTHATSIQALSAKDRKAATDSRRKLLGDLAECLRTDDFSETWENSIVTHSLKPSCYL